MQHFLSLCYVMMSNVSFEENKMQRGVVGWVNFQCRDALLIWIRVGQGPTALAVGAQGGGGVVCTFYSRLPFLFSFSISGRRPDID